MPDPFVFADVPDAPPDVVDLTSDDEHHLRTVLRLDAGDPLVLSDGRGRVWDATLAPDAGARLTSTAQRHPARRPALHVLQALPKGRKLDEIVRALVELGVDRITPVAAQRSVRQLGPAKRERELTRWRAIAHAAAGQSRRPWLADVRPVTGVTQAATGLREDQVLGCAPHPEATTPLHAALEKIPVGTDRGAGAAGGGGDPHDGGVDAASPSLPEEVAIAVGPEGGWNDTEIDAWQRAGLVPVSLGPSILRTEHAAFAVAAVVSYVLGRLQGQAKG